MEYNYTLQDYTNNLYITINEEGMQIMDNDKELLLSLSPKRAKAIKELLNNTQYLIGYEEVEEENSIITKPIYI